METTRFFCLLFATLFGVTESLEKASCPRPLNIVFLLKTSKNFNIQTFGDAKRLIRQTADSFQIIPRQTDMAVILSGPSAIVAVQFGQNDTNHFKQEVDKLGLSKDEQPIVSYDGMFDRAIPYAGRAVVVMTTGEDDEMDDPIFIEAVKDMKVSNTSHVFVIQLTQVQDIRRLLDIATDYDLIYNVEDILGNGKQQGKFHFQICSSLGDLRLNGTSLNRGCLEVYKNKTWSPVCSPTWNNSLTDIICQRLGFSVNDSVGNCSDDSLSFLSKGIGNSSIEYGCETIGGSNTYRNCSRLPSCRHIVCKVPVRISGSPSRPHIGLAEVFFLGTWGTICSDTFNEHSANIVCQKLGYPVKSLMTFVDVSNDISSLPTMLMSIDCLVERGQLEQHCNLIKCDRKCSTTCKNRPVSVLCDTSKGEATETITIKRTTGPKITIPCTMYTVMDVKWYYENGHERRKIIMTNNGSRIKFYDKDPKESRLTIRNILLKDGGAYFCESGSSRKMFFLFIKVNVSKVERKQYFYVGEDGRLTCNVFGSPPPSLEWRKDDKPLGLEKTLLWKYIFQEDGALLIRNLSSQDVGEYECKFKQNTGEIIDHERINIRLHLYEKPHTTTILNPNRTVVNGKSVSFTCSAKGRPEPNITWYMNNTAILNHKYLKQPLSGDQSIVTLNIQNVTNEDYGRYTCTARNDAGSESAFAWITADVTGDEDPLINGENKENILTSRWLWFVVFFVCLFVIGAIGLVVWITRRKRRKDKFLATMSELFVISSKSCDIWELPKGSLSLQKIIGKGMFGEVWKAVALNKNKNNNGGPKEQIVAVKKPKDDASDIQKEMLKQEISINKNLTGKKHKNIVNFLGCFISDDLVMMVMEFVPYGDLLGYLRESRGIKDKFYYHCEELPHKQEISPYELFSFATQIACGMAFLAKNKVIHRDLAARNVLVGENLVCKITDFGLAKVMKDGNSYMGSRKGRLPIKWTAPEVFITGDANISITSQCDVWSYGITLYEIFTIGGDPYPGMGEWDIVCKIKSDKYIMPKPEHINDEIYDIMVSCWRKDPELRPSFDELHKALTKMVETDYYLELDMSKYQSHMYAYIENMDEDPVI